MRVISYTFKALCVGALRRGFVHEGGLRIDVEASPPAENVHGGDGLLHMRRSNEIAV